MTIVQLRALILLGNLSAVGGLVVVGGGVLWRFVLPPAPQKTVDIPKPKVDVQRREPKPPRDTFKSIWNIPVVPNMQPRPDQPATTAQPTGPSDFSVEQAEALLRQAFQLRMTHPNWERPEFSYASLVVRTGQQEELLVAPDHRPLGHRVLRVEDDYVLFEVKGVAARLGFEGDGESWAQATAAAERGTPDALGGGLPPERPSGAEPFVAQAKLISSNEQAVLWHVSRTEATYVAENYNRILREVGVAPHRGTDGQIDGIELTSVSGESLVAKRGFVERDVIKSVNGEPVNDPRTLSDVLRRQQGKPQIVIVYTRRGVDHTVTYQVK